MTSSTFYFPNGSKQINCLPAVPQDEPLDVVLLSSLYQGMFRGGYPSFGIPSIGKLKHMAIRRRKDSYADGLNASLGYDLTIEFSRELNMEDAPTDWWNFAQDKTNYSILNKLC